MGNSHSSAGVDLHALDLHLPAHAHAHAHAHSNPPRRTRVLSRKRSAAALSALTFGCTGSAPYAASICDSDDDSTASSSSSSASSTAISEKHGKFDPPPLYAAACSSAELSLHPTEHEHEGGESDEEGRARAAAYRAFLDAHPEFQLTWIVDALRRSDYARLDRAGAGAGGEARRAGEAYVDYMGGALYPESLVRVHAGFLQRGVLGNTHSVSNASKQSSACAAEARAAVLAFFRAPPGYTVVFTANASAALKLVGEAFPFAAGSSFVLPADAHNSVHGIRQFAHARGAQVAYVSAGERGGVDVDETKAVLERYRPRAKRAASLFALTGQSNITNAKAPLALARHAAALGYSTLLDAAALAPTSIVSLSETPVDAMAISFYKMFGFPTGVGALVVREDFLARLERPWFAGGTVDVVQAPGTLVTMTTELHERFEDGTINYLSLPAITDGLRFLSAYLPFLPLRLSALTRHLVHSLTQLRHATTGTPVVRVLSRVPERQLRAVGEQADAGSVVALLFLFPSGEMVPNSFVEYAASRQGISLRTGCMCNPGGAAALLGLRDAMAALPAGVTLRAFEQHMGRELGVVRVSLGLASDFRDVWRVLRFAQAMGDARARGAMWEEWVGSLAGEAM